MRTNRRRLLRLALALSLAACGKSPAARMLPAGAQVLALGDSLTAGRGARSGEDWPSRLAALTGWQVANAGVSGDTSAGALERLPGLLADAHYDAVLVGIGGNDMLRSMPREATAANLAAIVQAAQARTPYVAVIATPAPDVWRAAAGLLQDADFYARVADETHAVLIPGVYAETLSDAALRSDTVHANAAGYARIADGIAERLHAAGWR